MAAVECHCAGSGDAEVVSQAGCCHRSHASGDVLPTVSHNATHLPLAHDRGGHHRI